VAEQRYSLINATHSLATAHCADNLKASLEKSYEHFIVDRSGDFFDTLSSQETFATHVNSIPGSFEIFWGRLRDQFRDEIAFDEHYTGCIPTFLKPPRLPIATGPQNVLERLFIANRLRERSRSLAGVFASGERRDDSGV
jgi:hypothetical protein